LKKQRTDDPLRQLKESCRHVRIPSVSLLNCGIASGQRLSMNQPAKAIPLPQQQTEPVLHRTNVQMIHSNFSDKAERGTRLRLPSRTI